MKKVILCRGIQGSGKSTWAKKYVLEDSENRVRFNNDDIRNMLGKYWVPDRENIVKDIKDAFLRSSMLYGYDIVIDNMNLNPKELEYYNRIVSEWNNPKETHSDEYRPKYEIETKDFFIPLQECIDRDAKRENPIGEETIRKTYEKYKGIIIQKQLENLIKTNRKLLEQKNFFNTPQKCNNCTPSIEYCVKDIHGDVHTNTLSHE